MSVASTEARRRRASSCPCRSILGHFLLLSFACLKGTTLAASSIPPLSVLSSRWVPAGAAPAAATASAPRNQLRNRKLSTLLSSCRGGAAAVTQVETQKGLGPMETFLHTIKEARRHLAAAAVARSVSIFGMCEFCSSLRMSVCVWVGGWVGRHLLIFVRLCGSVGP